ncbi:ATP-binding protein [Brevibacterium daeguense]|uniref:histidine kinase n=1 Tax=Brevibacterium daeguense TaxID=909936 RepID=A0ABP8ENT5_9MICO
MLTATLGGLLIAGGVSYTLQAKNVSDRANAEIDDEIQDLRTVAEAGREGRPFASVDELLFTAMSADVPSEHESFAALIDGRVAYVPAGERAVDLTAPDLLAHVDRLADPNQVVTSDISADGRLLRIAVVPVQVTGDPAQGYFLVAYDIGFYLAEVARSAWVYAGVSLATLVLVGVLGSAVMKGLLRPVREINEVAERADANDLSARVDVTGSGDEIDRLGAGFNSMLDRVQAGVQEQRRFLSDAGHELRTPLTIIRGNLEVMDESDPDDVVETRALILDEVDRMNRMVEDLLLLSKARRADFVQRGRESAATIIAEVAAKAANLGTQRVEAVTSVDQAIAVDRQRIEQAMLQLVRNAVTYTPPHSTIAISASTTSAPARHPEAGPAALFSVIDNGPGIAVEEQEHVFKRFHRGTTGRGSEGTGLGLSIVAAIARAHGGWVDLESEPGHGCAFTIVIPRTPYRKDLEWPTS